MGLKLKLKILPNFFCKIPHSLECVQFFWENTVQQKKYYRSVLESVLCERNEQCELKSWDK